MIRVKVLKLAGETGLRQPGSTYFETDAKAAKLCAAGVVAVLSETTLETKEEKFKPKGRPKRK